MCFVCAIFLLVMSATPDIVADKEQIMSVADIVGNLEHYKELAKSDVKPPDMSLETLAAGVERHSALIRSGHGTISYISTGAQEEVLMGVFTFEGRKMRSDILEGVQAGVDKICNGEIEISISRKDGRVVKGTLCSVDPCMDPRSWYNVRGRYYLEDPLERRLRAAHARFVGVEQIGDQYCYVVDISANRKEPNLLWICPEMGFRVLRSYNPCWIEKPVITHRSFRYKVYKQGNEKIWFPQRVEYILLPANSQSLTAEQLAEMKPNVLTVHDDFRINLDVSSYFQPRFPPDTEVFDLASRRTLPIQEVLPEFIED